MPRHSPPAEQGALHQVCTHKLELRSTPTCCGQNGRSIVRLELCLVLYQQVAQPRHSAGLMADTRVLHKRVADCEALRVIASGCCSLMGVEGELAVVDPSSKEAGTSSLQDSQDVRPCSLFILESLLQYGDRCCGMEHALFLCDGQAKRIPSKLCLGLQHSCVPRPVDV